MHTGIQKGTTCILLLPTPPPQNYKLKNNMVNAFIILQMLKKNRKNYIIELSKEYSIVTQFTSFVAIEKREKVWVTCVKLTLAW